MEPNQTQSKIQAVEIPTPVKHRGGKRPGAGRKPANFPTVNPAAPLAVIDLLKPVATPNLQAITARKSPLERLYEVMANGRVPWATRVRAMGLAAEYVHAKQPQAIHVTQDVRLAAVVVHTMPGPWEPKAAMPAPATHPALPAPFAPPEVHPVDPKADQNVPNVVDDPSFQAQNDDQGGGDVQPETPENGPQGA